MIFYEIEHSDGHYLVATQSDAKREARERKCTWSQTDIPTDKAGLMEHLNSLMSYSSACEAQAERASEAAFTKPEGYTEQPIRDDDWFDKLPIARQLDFGARAMENARDAL